MKKVKQQTFIKIENEKKFSGKEWKSIQKSLEKKLLSEASIKTMAMKGTRFHPLRLNKLTLQTLLL